MFSNASAAHPSDVSAFLGSPSTGGFLKDATDTLNGLEDPTTGIIQTTITSAQTAIDNQNQKISDEQDRIDALTTSLTAKIDAADALIASLEQQQTYFTTLFTDMNGNIKEPRELAISCTPRFRSGAWSTAQELLAAFRLEVEASWRAAATEQERRAISQNVTGFLQWARAMTITSREHAQDAPEPSEPPACVRRAESFQSVSRPGRVSENRQRSDAFV